MVTESSGPTAGTLTDRKRPSESSIPRLVPGRSTVNVVPSPHISLGLFAGDCAKVAGESKTAPKQRLVAMRNLFARDFFINERKAPQARVIWHLHFPDSSADVFRTSSLAAPVCKRPESGKSPVWRTLACRTRGIVLDVDQAQNTGST